MAQNKVRCALVCMACGKGSPWISTADLSLMSAPLVRYTASFNPKPGAAVCPNRSKDFFPESPCGVGLRCFLALTSQAILPCPSPMPSSHFHIFQCFLFHDFEPRAEYPIYRGVAKVILQVFLTCYFHCVAFLSAVSQSPACIALLFQATFAFISAVSQLANSISS